MLKRRTLALTLAAVAALAAPAAASANTVIDWNQYAETAINRGEQQRGQPTAVLLDTVIVQGAVYDAVNAVTRTNQPDLTRRGRAGGTPMKPRSPPPPIAR